jgi:O-antigen/teichoic acid export membrane protein
MERLSDITEARKLEIVKMSYLYIFGSILLLILISLFAPLFFRYLIDRRYESGTRYVFWVALGYCFWGGYMLFSGFIFFFKKNRILAWLAVFNVISNLLFNYFFILRFGAIGAAYAKALSFFLLLILIAYQANKLVQLPWFNFKLIFAGVRKNV